MIEVKLLREKLNLTRLQFAEKIGGITAHHVYQIESKRREPSFALLRRIAEVGGYELIVKFKKKRST